jgi:circadian clock protein KaiC
VRRLFIDGLGGFERAAVDRERLHHYFTALANELRALGVTTVYSAESGDIVGPTVTAPLGGISGVAENLILLRFLREGPTLQRIISLLKVRDSKVDPTLYRILLTPDGIKIDDAVRQADSHAPATVVPAVPKGGQRRSSPRR